MSKISKSKHTIIIIIKLVTSRYRQIDMTKPTKTNKLDLKTYKNRIGANQLIYRKNGRINGRDIHLIDKNF